MRGMNRPRRPGMREAMLDASTAATAPAPDAAALAAAAAAEKDVCDDEDEDDDDDGWWWLAWGEGKLSASVASCSNLEVRGGEGGCSG